MNLQNYYKTNKIISFIDRRTLNIFLIDVLGNGNSRKYLKFMYKYFNLFDYEIFRKYEENSLDVSMAYVKTRKTTDEIIHK